MMDWIGMDWSACHGCLDTAMHEMRARSTGRWTITIKTLSFPALSFFIPSVLWLQVIFLLEYLSPTTRRRLTVDSFPPLPTVARFYRCIEPWLPSPSSRRRQRRSWQL